MNSKEEYNYVVENLEKFSQDWLKDPEDETIEMKKIDNKVWFRCIISKERYKKQLEDLIIFYKEREDIRYQTEYLMKKIASLEEIKKEIIEVKEYILNKKQAESLKKSKRIGRRIRDFILERDNYMCKNCNKKFPRAFLHIDHINPVSNGGLNTPENLQILCRDCNSIKAHHLFLLKKGD